ncbi:hypothetical protein Aca07nite_45260 [Actinoplanes capillaceus]|uniref:ATP-grasp target RiPP n=1 Tax=Actinoplanes campanulatus TaxID=113559 RepID=A0ABQ3WLX2_9ACTN|nr:hypothetical protein Aca07nite_45260 [Actinoplanes capillaceus]
MAPDKPWHAGPLTDSEYTHTVGPKFPTFPANPTGCASSQSIDQAGQVSSVRLEDDLQDDDDQPDQATCQRTE